MSAQRLRFLCIPVAGRLVDLNAGRGSTRLELKNEAFWTDGNVRGIRNANASARSHRPAMTAAPRAPSVRSSERCSDPRLATIETVM